MSNLFVAISRKYRGAPRSWLRAALSIAITLGAITDVSYGFDIRYWVWQREDPLDESELAELAAQKVDTIYWHVGELENVGGIWRWKARFAFPTATESQLRCVPVVRLVSHEQQPFSSASMASLLGALSSAIAKHDELQLDYDAPDRLLSDYSAALKRIHELVPRLTITALPHWARTECLSQLEPNVDELLPMLYDFEAEPVLKNHSSLPLIAPEKMANMLNDWRRCDKPWRAGLPVFARLTVYDASGRLRGQIRNWNWDELCFNRNFAILSGARFGASVLRATRSTSVANTPLRPGEELVVRETDRAALREAMAAARQTGAQGVVLFRLPDSSASSGWSLHQLAHLDAQPQLTLRRSDSSESLEVENSGGGDLEPRFATNESTSGGYELELQTDTAIFREAEPGDFARVAAYSQSGDGIKPAPIPFATRLLFKFSHLRARQSLRSGLIQLAPGSDFRYVRYRFRNFEEESWKPLE